MSRRAARITRQWLGWLTDEIGKLGLKVTPSVGEFRADPFPARRRARPPPEADAFLTKRGLVLRAVERLRLPNALRMTVGSEEANRLVVEALARVHGRQAK